VEDREDQTLQDEGEEDEHLL
jgi:hypothetical protein